MCVVPATSASCKQSFKTWQYLVQSTPLTTLHISCTQCVIYSLHPFSGSHLHHQTDLTAPTPAWRSCICVENPFPLLLSQNENAIKDSKQCSTICRSSHNYPSDSKAHNLPELSRMMDLRHTNSSPWRFIMRNRAAVASSMSKISTMPSTHFPWFLCEYHKWEDIQF